MLVKSVITLEFIIMTLNAAKSALKSMYPFLLVSASNLISKTYVSMDAEYIRHYIVSWEPDSASYTYTYIIISLSGKSKPP